ncbi:MAG TPA: hypothetical protein VFX73_03050 [Chitinophagaceae bacterium]|nr:hypothetical protein [Chitinophagaceae bacterium]
MNKISLGIIFLLFAGLAQSQTLDEVIDRHVTALGGMDKLRQMRSVYMEGVSVMQNGNEISSKMWKVDKQLLRREINFGMGSAITVVTDKEGWSSNPRNGNKFEALPQEAVQMQQTELDCAGPLVDYKAKGHTAELIGKEDFEGTECYKVKLSLKTGRDITYFIDTKNYYILAFRAKGGGMGGMRRQGGGGDTEVTVTYSDYRKTAEGFVFPYAMAVAGMGAATNYEVIEVNKPVDPKLYKPE